LTSRHVYLCLAELSREIIVGGNTFTTTGKENSQQPVKKIIFIILNATFVRNRGKKYFAKITKILKIIRPNATVRQCIVQTEIKNVLTTSENRFLLF
jgi:hypothetical protein